MFYAEYKHKVHISSRVFVRKIALVVAQSTFVDPKEKNITREPRAREENFFLHFRYFCELSGRKKISMMMMKHTLKAIGIQNSRDHRE